MGMNQALLQEFDMEMPGTRKTLANLPDGKMAWRPHEKSFIMGSLAWHLADMPAWATHTIGQDELEVAGFPGYPPPEEITREKLLEIFDKNVAQARKDIEGASDETLMKPWSLLVHGQKIFTMSKMVVLRNFVMNHMIHHRAQLGVYLRLNDCPVPGLYGPSADEKAT